MRTPIWAIVVGICMILFGGCSITKSFQSVNMPNMLEMQEEMMGNLAQPISIDSLNLPDSVKAAYNSEQVAKTYKNMANGMQKMFAMSEFAQTWSVRFGYIGFVVAIIYIFSGIFLLIRKPFSIKLVYGALVLSIVFSIIQSFVLASDPAVGMMAMSAGFGNVFGIIIDVILIVVVIMMNRSEDYQPTGKIE